MRLRLWIVALAACGNSGVHHLDDGGADAPEGIDAVVPDVPSPDANRSGPVTIRVTTNGTPAAGATVYFLNADDSVVAETTTASDGTATEVMLPGGTVTLVEPAAGVELVPANQNLDTFEAVVPGDVLRLDVGAAPVVGVTAQVTVPTDPNAAAVSYTLFTTCGSTVLGGGGAAVAGRRARPVDPPSALPFGSAARSGIAGPFNQPPAPVTFDNCPASTDMLVVTADGSGNVLDSLFAPAVALGSDITVTGTYAAIAPRSLVATDVPAGVTAIDVNHFIVSSTGQVVFTESPAVALGTTATATAEEPAVTGGVSVLEGEFLGGSDLLDRQTIAAWNPQSTGTVTVDATTGRLPDYVAAPAFDPATQRVTYQMTGGGSAAIDALFTFVTFSRDLGSGTVATWSWTAIAPGGQAGAVIMPVLPADLFAWNGSAGDTIAVDTMEMGAVTGGYDAVRANGIDLDFDAVLDTSTANGAVILDYFTPAPSAGLRAAAPPARPHRRAWRTRR